MKPHRCLLAGLLLAGGLTGCSDDSPKTKDAAVADGPVAANDVAADSPTVPRNDASTATDEPEARDANKRDGFADLAAPDLGPADQRTADRSPTPDQATPETRAADVPAADRQAGDSPRGDGAAPDLTRADVVEADKPEAAAAVRDVSGDGGCTGWTTMQRISPADAKKLIDESDPIVINVHIPYEGDIPGTDASLPYNDVDAIEKYLNHNHCADVLLVCRSDHMSQLAGDELVKRGYLRIRDLKGGFVAWEDAGYPLLKDGGP